MAKIHKNNRNGECSNSMKYKIKYLTIELSEGSDIKSPDTAFQILKDDFSPLQESLYLLGLNNKNAILLKELVAKGHINRISITPSDIFRPLLLNNCNSFILAHNHPSRELSPSPEDEDFTSKIKEASNLMGLSFLDHIIFSNTDFFSFKKEGILL